MNPKLSAIISDIKDTISILHFLIHYCGLRVPHSSSAICTPSFVREGDSHPSFGVYNSIAIDFATGSHYDVIDLAQLYYSCSFLEAVEKLYGKPIYTGRLREDQITALNVSQQQLDRNVSYWHSELLKRPDLLDYLHKRGISDDTITRFQIGYSNNRKRIMFPFSTGKRWCYFAGRDITDNWKTDGKKYMKGRLHSKDDQDDNDSDSNERACYLNVPWGLQTLHRQEKRKSSYIGVDGETYCLDAEDPRDATLFVTEGLVDALSLAQDGWQALATGGGFMPKDYERTFFDIARSYSRVIICFDNDDAGGDFQKAMCQKLFAAQINFVCGHIPQTVNGTPVKDINDYCVAGGDLTELVSSATPGLVEMARATQSLDELANLFTKAARWMPSYKLFELKEACYALIDPKTGFQKYTGKMINHLYAMSTMAIPEPIVAKMVTDKHTLLFDPAGVFYEYTKGIWSELSDFEIQHYVGEALGMRASSGRMRSVTNYLKSELVSRDPFNRKPLHVLRNGTIDLAEALVDKTKAFRPHSEADMSTQLIPCDYDPEAKCEKWLKYVAEGCGGSEKKMRLMQQMAGYILCPDNRYHKFFYLLGDGANGKSTFMNVLEAVYGSENCSSVQPSRLNSQFDPIALKDSLANFCYEAKTILNGSEEALKAIVSGDPIMAAHKGVDAVKFSTRAKIFIAANKCFASEDVSLGFLRRIIFFKFDQQFTGEKANKNLYHELMEELPGIFNWCLDGYIDLVNSGGFVELEDQADVIDDLLSQMSPTGLFIKEVFPSQAGTLTERDIYNAYKLWCEEGGFKKLNRIEFMKDIMLLIRQRKTTIDVKVRSNNEGRKIFIFPSGTEDEDMGAQFEAPGNGPAADDVIALGPESAPSDPEAAADEEPSAQAEQSEPVADQPAVEAGQVSREVKDIDTHGNHALTPEEVESGMKTTFDTPDKLSAHYKAGLAKPGDLTLGDWRALYAYYRCYPAKKPDYFDSECREYVKELKASFQKGEREKQ